MSHEDEVRYGKRHTDVEHFGYIPNVKPTRFYALYANAWEAAIALAAVVTAVAFWFDPNGAETAPLANVLGGWDDVWYMLYGVGGAMVLLGLLLHGRQVFFRGVRLIGDGRVELSGLVLIATAIVVNVVAIANAGFLRTPSVATYAGLLVACFLRGRTLMAERKAQVPVIVPGSRA